MNIKQTTESLTENGYTCKRSAWGALEASRLSERVSIYFARRGKNGRNAERVCVHLVGCFSQRNNGIRAREFSLAKRLSKTIFAGVEVWQNGCGHASFFNGVLKK